MVPDFPRSSGDNPNDPFAPANPAAWLGHGAKIRIAGLNAILADPDLYARDQRRFGAATQALDVARDELVAAEEQWLTLEMLREEIDDVERKS
jgi:hypothetical protein